MINTRQTVIDALSQNPSRRGKATRKVTVGAETMVHIYVHGGCGGVGVGVGADISAYFVC